MMKSYCPIVPPEPRYHTGHNVTIKKEPVLLDGVLCEKFVEVPLEVEKIHEGLTCTDFLLTTLLANGATSLLKEVPVKAPSALELASQVSNVIENI